MRRPVENPGNDPPADDQHEGGETRDLDQGADGGGEQVRSSRPVSGLHLGEDGKEDQGHHHGQVLDDQPADGDPAPLGLHQVFRLQGAQQDDRAGDRQGEAKDQTGRHRPSHHQGETDAHGRG